MPEWNDYAAEDFASPLPHDTDGVYRLLLAPALHQHLCLTLAVSPGTLTVSASSALLWDYLQAKRIMQIPHQQDRALSGFVHAMDRRSKTMTDLAQRLEDESPPNIDHAVPVDDAALQETLAALKPLLPITVAPSMPDLTLMDGLTIQGRYRDGTGQTGGFKAENPKPDTPEQAYMVALLRLAHRAVVENPARNLLEPLWAMVGIT